MIFDQEMKLDLSADHLLPSVACVLDTKKTLDENNSTSAYAVQLDDSPPAKIDLADCLACRYIQFALRFFLEYRN